MKAEVNTTGEYTAVPDVLLKPPITPRENPLQYYVLSVRTGGEEKFLSFARRLVQTNGGRFVWPRRSLTIRRGGRKIDTLASLYPGYLFWETQELNEGIEGQMREVPEFYRFLTRDGVIAPLNEREKQTLLDIISYGEVIRKSRVVFDENSRIRVIEGPLKNLEGNIIRVDRRKGRARVCLSLHGRSLDVDLGFEVMEPGEDCGFQQ